MDIEKFARLLEEQKIAEAKIMLEDYMRTEPAPEDKGAVLASAAMAYAAVKNKISAEYAAELKESLALLSDIDKEERSVDDAIKLEEIRSKLRPE